VGWFRHFSICDIGQLKFAADGVYYICPRGISMRIYRKENEWEKGKVRKSEIWTERKNGKMRDVGG
jgi:hypothetical protein